MFKYITIISLLSINNQINNEKTLHSLVESFWKQEELSDNNRYIFSSEEETAENIFSQSKVFLPNGRYQVDIPLISNYTHVSLGTSFQTAKNRFIRQENKLSKNPQLSLEYKKQLTEYIDLG